MLNVKANIHILKGFLSFLTKLDHDLLRRFHRNIAVISDQVSILLRTLEKEVVLLQKVEAYRSYGFIVDVNFPSNTSHDDAIKLLTSLITNMDELIPIVQKYRQIAYKLPVAQKHQFENLIKYPERHKEIKHLWDKITH
jgi:hypothetical protein